MDDIQEALKDLIVVTMRSMYIGLLAESAIHIIIYY